MGERMIGVLVIIEWLYSQLTPANHAHLDAENDRCVHRSVRDQLVAECEAKRREIEVEDAKFGTPAYNSELIYWLLAEERLLYDRACAEQFAFLEAAGRQAYL